jgi:YidC/Oxa1 family membrane protein insertase
MLFDTFILPIKILMELCLRFAYDLSNNWGLSIIMLSIVVSLIMLPLQKLADRYRKKEQAIQDAMKDEIALIKKCYTGIKRSEFIWTLYRQYHYNPIYALRGSIGLLLLIPLFYSAYDLLVHFKPLEGVPFLFIRDLSKPDGALGGINVLPILMTIVSLLNLWVTVKVTKNADGWKQLAVLMALFLVLLYNAPSGVVLYWTMNNIFGVFKTLLGVFRLKTTSSPASTVVRGPVAESNVATGFLARWPVHVVLLPFFALTFLLLANARAGFHGLNSYLPVLPYWVVPMVLIWLILSALTRDIRRAGLALTIAGVLWFFGGTISEVLADQFNDPHVLGQRLEIWMTLAIAGLGFALMLWILWKWRSPQKLARLTVRVNTIALALVFLLMLQSIVAVDAMQRSSVALSPPPPWPRPALTEVQKENLPNIVILYMDGLPDAKSMELYDCGDLSWFVRRLEELGFTIPDKAYAIHSQTRQISPATLNSLYLPSLVGWANESPPHAALTYYIHHNEAFPFFRSYGYETYSRSQGPDYQNVGAENAEDIKFAGQTSEFQTGVIHQSVFNIAQKLFRRFMASFKEQIKEYSLSCIDSIKDSTEHMKLSQRPLFSFSQMLTGHAPYVFNEDGSLREASLFTVNAEAFNKKDLEHFNAQVQYLCKETLATIEETLEKQKTAERPLVIFLVSDHGLHEFSKTLNTKLAEGRPFAAYYSSDGRLPALDSFALPNMFRMILHSYWPIPEEEFPLLPSRSLLQETVDGKWSFVDRTEEVDGFFEEAWKKKARGEPLYDQP